MIDALPLNGPMARARDALHAHGMRWTPQRRALLELLFESEGHVTGAELLERARARDPETQPSTVYRTLDAIEEIGLVVHSHAADGREEYHVLPHAKHGHLSCETCGRSWELTTDEARDLAADLLATRDFELDVSHLTLVGRCSGCGTK